MLNQNVRLGLAALATIAWWPLGCTDIVDVPTAVVRPSFSVVDTFACGNNHLCDTLTTGERDQIEMVVNDIDDTSQHCWGIKHELELKLSDPYSLVKYYDDAGDWGWYNPNDDIIGIWVDTFGDAYEFPITVLEEADHAPTNDHQHLGWPTGHPQPDNHWTDNQSECIFW